MNHSFGTRFETPKEKIDQLTATRSKVALGYSKNISTKFLSNSTPEGPEYTFFFVDSESASFKINANWRM